MQPTNARDFLKVSLQRLTAAEQIVEVLRLTLEAQSIGGYSVECSFKGPFCKTQAKAIDQKCSIDSRAGLHIINLKHYCID